MRSDGFNVFSYVVFSVEIVAEVLNITCIDDSAKHERVEVSFFVPQLRLYQPKEERLRFTLEASNTANSIITAGMTKAIAVHQ